MVVTALRAHPDPNRLDVGPTETALVHVRSQGVGTDTIMVAGGPYVARVPVVYDLPWLFVLAVAVGGVLGGLLNGLSRKRRTTQPVLARLALQGVLTGLAVAVLYAAGIKVFEWAPDGDYGEALTFALSFFGGLAGPRIFDRFLPGAEQGRDPKREPESAPGG
jgi:ribose/xylose/arabinose/galactoside ABC-type transport system permease subunit